jgi:hypothetical protein
VPASGARFNRGNPGGSKAGKAAPNILNKVSRTPSLFYRLPLLGPDSRSKEGWT